MSGGSGGPIIIRHARIALSDPTVHGQFPPMIAAAVDMVLAKTEGTEDDHDKWVLAGAFYWAMFHCS